MYSDRDGSQRAIQRFKLIGCDTRKVICTKGNTQYPYASLSYSWGSVAAAKAQGSSTEVSIEGTALVIEDTMVVTKQI